MRLGIGPGPFVGVKAIRSIIINPLLNCSISKKTPIAAQAYITGFCLSGLLLLFSFPPTSQYSNTIKTVPSLFF